jgi:hypothetical protein
MATSNLERTATTIYPQHLPLFSTSAPHHRSASQNNKSLLAAGPQHQHQQPLAVVGTPLFHHQHPPAALQRHNEHEQTAGLVESCLFPVQQQQQQQPLAEASNPLMDRFFGGVAGGQPPSQLQLQLQQQPQSLQQAAAVCQLEAHSATAADLQQAAAVSMHTIQPPRPLRNISPASRSTDSSSEPQYVGQHQLQQQHHHQQHQHQYLAKEIAPLVNVVPIDDE